MIKLKNITKKYDNGTVALDNVSLTIKEGEMIAIMGASGSGKTTLLNIIGCMDNATAGTYLMNGIDVTALKGEKLHKFRCEHISFVFQNFALIDDYTALENVEVPLVAKGVRRSERKKRALAAMKTLGIDTLAKNKPTKMSGGQQQRIAIARAIVSDNELILADEPTGALDKNTGLALMETLRQLNKAGKTVLIVTHDSHIASFCDRTVYIEDGMIR